MQSASTAAPTASLPLSEDLTFEDHFKQMCKIEWKTAVDDCSNRNYLVVYLVVDEAQWFYEDEISLDETRPISTRAKSQTFWEMVKYVLNNAAYRVRVLMFAAFGSCAKHAQVSIPISFPNTLVVSSEILKLSSGEIAEYVSKWFLGVGCFSSSPAAFGAFCSMVQVLTGGHGGSCSTAVSALNEYYLSLQRAGISLLSPEEWIIAVQTGTVQTDKEERLFDVLTTTPPVHVPVLSTLSTDDMDQLECVVYGASAREEPDLME